MGNLIQSTTDFAMHIARQYIKRDGIVIDATCGNGHDTLRLAESIRNYVGSAKLIAFDIQRQAIESTKARLEAADFDANAITLIHGSHELIGSEAFRESYLKGEKVCLIVFNLGYLPGGDKGVTTKAGSTISTVKSALEVLDEDGLICLTIYSGHEEGAKEKQALLAFAEELDSHIYHVSYISMINQRSNPPEILLISRKC